MYKSIIPYLIAVNRKYLLQKEQHLRINYMVLTIGDNELYVSLQCGHKVVEESFIWDDTDVYEKGILINDGIRELIISSYDN